MKKKAKEPLKAKLILPQRYSPEPGDRSRVHRWSEQPDKSAILLPASNVRPRSHDWVWPGHLLRGAQELLTGDPGLGKSQVQIHFIACATTGSAWPDGAPGIDPVNVVMLTAEDCLEQDVIPRLIAAGADRERVHILKAIKSDGKSRQFLLSEDLDELEKAVNEIGNVGLVTVDPITAYMGSRMDSHKATEVRSQLGPLKDFAEATGIAVSSITHPPKQAGSRALDHFIGSQAFIAAGRIGHICIEDFDVDEETGEKTPTGRVLFANPKTNPSQKMPTLAFHVEPRFICNDEVTGEPIEAPFVVWDGVVDITADEALAVTSAVPLTAQDRLRKLLYEILKNGPVDHEVIMARTSGFGFTEKQLRLAKDALRIESGRNGFGPGSKVFWKL